MFRNMAKNRLGILLLSVATSLSACMALPNASTMTIEDLGSIMTVREGHIVAFRPVEINTGKGKGKGSGGMGALTGALAGASIGSQGDDFGVRGALATLFGGLFGAAIEKSVTTKKGYAYTIKLLDSGEILSIPQADEEPIETGTPVTVEISPDGFTRIVRGHVSGGGHNQNVDATPAPDTEPQAHNDI